RSRRSEFGIWYKESLAFSRTGSVCGKPILVLKTIFGGGVHFSESSAGGPSVELSKSTELSGIITQICCTFKPALRVDVRCLNTSASLYNYPLPFKASCESCLCSLLLFPRPWGKGIIPFPAKTKHLTIKHF
uniref:Uncharacterized protein n=1 Tax=Malurus cyaneus samueli TaxID=2593467 RepID=A0A8C5T358_9PASS